jgi:YVTN family beta-propeller protein
MPRSFATYSRLITNRVTAFSCVLFASSLTSGQTLITNVSVGAYPVALAVNVQTNKIYVVNQNSNKVTVIDGATNGTTSVPTGNSPRALAINPTTNKIYVANDSSNTVTVIDGATNHTSTVPVGSYPCALDVNLATNKIYVSNYNSNSLTIIDGATNATSTLALGRHPCPVAVDSPTNKVYIGNRGDGNVTVLDGANNSMQLVAVGADPREIAINHYSNQIYVANNQAGTVTVIDGATHTVSTVIVGSYPQSVAVDPVHNRVYVANSGSDNATIIDGSTLATTTIAVGIAPNAVDVNPITNKAYFTNLNDYGSVTMVNGSDYSSASVLVGYMPEALALNPVTNRIYTANQGDGTASVLSGANSEALQFTTITPCRVVDTRLPPGPFGGPALSGGTSRSFAVPLSGCGVPPTALAYSLNVTAVPSGPLGYLTIWPSGEPQPQVSTLNSPDGRVKANAAIVPAGSAGAVSVFTSQTTNVLIDINGYFTAPGEQTLQFYPLTPCRVLDTRNQSGHLGGPYLHGTRERDFPVLESSCQVPPTAQAYSMNFTAVPWQGRPLGYLSTWAAGGSQPQVSTLNNPTATVVANAAIVPVGIGGAIAVYPSQDTDLIVDIDGYFAPPGAGGLSLYPTSPCRVLDTRTTGGAFSGQRSPAVNVAASPCGIPASAKGFTLNATALPLGSMNYLTLWPDGQTMPLASTLNAKDGIAASNMAILPNQDGKIGAYASGTTQLILDISSYFAP